MYQKQSTVSLKQLMENSNNLEKYITDTDELGMSNLNSVSGGGGSCGKPKSDSNNLKNQSETSTSSSNLCSYSSVDSSLPPLMGTVYGGPPSRRLWRK